MYVLGLFRPTKNVLIKGKRVDMPSWKTVQNTHFDINPWRYCSKSMQKAKVKPKPIKTNVEPEVLPHGLFKKYFPSSFPSEYNAFGNAFDGQVKIQGLINFADNKIEDGGIQVLFY